MVELLPVVVLQVVGVVALDTVLVELVCALEMVVFAVMVVVVVVVVVPSCLPCHRGHPSSLYPGLLLHVLLLCCWWVWVCC